MALCQKQLFVLYIADNEVRYFYIGFLFFLLQNGKRTLKSLFKLEIDLLLTE